MSNRDMRKCEITHYNWGGGIKAMDKKYIKQTKMKTLNYQNL